MEGSTSSWFSKLPDELYLKIFRYLTHPEVCKCMQVCQKWKRLCSDDSLWTEVEVSLTKVASDDVLHKLASKFPRIKGLAIVCNDLEARMWKEFTCDENKWQRFENLEKVTFISCPSGLLSSVQGLVASCPRLNRFNCESSSAFDRKHLLGLLHPSRNYLEVSFAYCTQIDDITICSALSNPNIPNCFKKLESLNLDGLEFLSDVGTQGILEHCPALRSLTLDGEQLTDKTGHMIGSKLQALECLHISYCDNLTDSTLRSFGRLKNLRILYMKRGPCFTNDGIVSFFKQLSLHKDACRNSQGLLSLALIECRELVDSGLTVIAQSSPNLHHLDLSWCWNLTDRGLQAVAHNCHKIQKLKLVGLKEAKCTPIIGASMPRLRLLELVQTDLVDDDQLRLLKLEKPWITIFDYYGEEVDAG